MMDKRLNLFLKLIAVVLLLLIGMVSGVVLERTALGAAPVGGLLPGGEEEAGEMDRAFALMGEAWETIDRQYVDRSALDSTRLAYGAIQGMVDALGDTGHSRFMTPEIREASQTLHRGAFEGIGAYVESIDEQTVITSPMDGSPAQRAGLQPGDVILAVDGTDVGGLPLSEVVDMILGPAGTDVTLTILRPETAETWDVTVTRAKVELQHVSWQMLPEGSVGYVRIASFSQGVSDKLAEALKAMQEGGATGVVLDLRNNPGGLLSEAIETASQFLPVGSSVVLRQDAGGQTVTMRALPGGAALQLPVVVLINEGSASASEIVSGALQDHGRASLVGETTFGTGTVLNEFGLSDGSALLLAVEQWLTPDGRVIWHEGVAPDVEVALEPDVMPMLLHSSTPLTSELLAESQDAQLEAALELLAAE